MGGYGFRENQQRIKSAFYAEFFNFKMAQRAALKPAVSLPVETQRLRKRLQADGRGRKKLPG